MSLNVWHQCRRMSVTSEEHVNICLHRNWWDVTMARRKHTELRLSQTEKQLSISFPSKTELQHSRCCETRAGRFRSWAGVCLCWHWESNSSTFSSWHQICQLILFSAVDTVWYLVVCWAEIHMYSLIDADTERQTFKTSLGCVIVS